MINDRIHGTPISGEVKKKLEDRQRVAGEVAPGESIEAVFPDKDGNVQSDLSSRTPFARMWTSVKLIDRELITEKLEKIELGTGYSGMDEDTRLKVAQRKGIKRVGKLRKEFPEAKLTKIDGEYYIKNIGNDVREQVDYARKTYIIGDYNYQTAYGSVDTNASLEGETETTTQAGDVSDIFPQELKNNPLLSPQAGITGLTSETEGPFGEKKRTIVNFVVHNFEDYDKIYNKYFLKPGATIFVDFGWSSVKNLYNPTDLIDSPDIKKFLYESNVVPGYEDKEVEETLAEGESVEESTENIGEVAKNQGDLEVIQGLVVDYNSKILPNGSVDCEVTLVSANTALLGLTVDNSMRRHIQDTLGRATLYLGLEATLNNVTTLDAWDGNGDTILGQTADTLQYRNSVPDADISAKDLETFNKNLELEAYKVLSSGNLTPTGDSIRGGVYVNSAEADDVYVCWGFIEDIIINQNFGFGKNSDDINDGNNFRVKMDSSNQFTTWNEIFVERQQTLSKVPEEPPVFLLPEWWGGSDIGQDDSLAEETVVNGSYNYFNKKYPKNFYEDNEPFNHTAYDENKKRIPIREVFINAEIIILAFKRNKTVKKSLEDILKKINKDSNDVFDWKIVNGSMDSELTIIDNNRPDTGQKILDSGVSSNTSEDTVDEFKNLFTFNIMSPNSIVKDYNLEFKLPSGALGNMLSIQGMSHENRIFPLSITLDDMVAINSLDDDSLSIVYEPDLGSYRSGQNDSIENKDSDYYNVYQSANYLIDNNIYKTGIVRRSTDILRAAGLKSSKLNIENQKKDTSADKKPKDVAKEIISQYTQELINGGNKVVNSFKDYYRIKEIQQISLNTKFNLLPYTLSLTTYGIGSIVPGDTFKVDYLPKDHLKNSFLQTIKVAHNINSDGWYTTLETMYRPLLKNKKEYYLDVDMDKVYLSPTVLKNLNLDEGFYSATDNGTFKFIQHIMPYMYKLKIVREPTKYIDFMISFKTIRGLSDRMQDMRSGNTSYQIVQKKNAGLLNKIDSAFDSTLNLIAFAEGKYDNYIYPMNEALRPDQEYILIVQGRSSFITAKENFYSADGTNLILFYFDRPIDTLKPIPKEENQIVRLGDNTGGGGKVGACFVEGTQVTLTDGSTKNIEDIQVNDLVLSYNKDISKLESKQVTKLLHHTQEEWGSGYWIINNKLKVTQNHPMYTNNGIKLLKNLKINDILINEKLENVTIDSIKIINKKVEKYYNFEVEDNNNYFVENYLVNSI